MEDYSPLKLSTSTASESRFSLYKKYAVDFIAASSASFCVSPFIMIVDRSIIENAAGKRPLSMALKQLAYQFITRPHSLLMKKEFWLIYTVYFGTYVTANVIDTYGETSKRNTSWLKFIGATSVNMSTSIYKDREFARMFGVTAAHQLPAESYALFATRDMLTVGGSFNLPSYIASQCEKKMNIKRSSAHTLAQLSCPALLQLINSPLHLLALDFYNNRNSTIKQRIAFLKKEYWKTTFARIMRIGPAFGVGGVGNKYVKDTLRMKLETMNIDALKEKMKIETLKEENYDSDILKEEFQYQEEV